MTRRHLALATLAVLACLSTASADVVTTKEGLVLEGTVAKDQDGTVTVTTSGGAVRLAAADVVSVVAGEVRARRPRRRAGRCRRPTRPGTSASRSPSTPRG